MLRQNYSVYATQIIKFTCTTLICKQWEPDIVDTQLLKLGQLIIAAVPGEFTTMSGRRLRDSIRQTVQHVSHDNDTEVVIAGLSNVYTHYIATYEEYQKQRYEAASTIYGPHTLMAYQEQFSFLARKLALGEKIDDEGPHPPNLHDKQISFVPNVDMDRPPLGKNFGDCLLQVSLQTGMVYIVLL